MYVGLHFSLLDRIRIREAANSAVAPIFMGQEQDYGLSQSFTELMRILVIALFLYLYL